jgi:hypothetical protein
MNFVYPWNMILQKIKVQDVGACNEDQPEKCSEAYSKHFRTVGLALGKHSVGSHSDDASYSFCLSRTSGFSQALNLAKLVASAVAHAPSARRVDVIPPLPLSRAVQLIDRTSDQVVNIYDSSKGDGKVWSKK